LLSSRKNRKNWRERRKRLVRENRQPFINQKFLFLNLYPNLN